MDTDTSSEKNSAPHPDSDKKPDSPGDLSKPSWKYILRRSVSEFSKDECTDLAAGMTYYAVLSLFPGLLAVVSLLGVFGQGEATTRTILQLLSNIGAPAQAMEVLEGPLSQLTNSPGAGLALVTGVLGALWSASGYVRGFARSMNRIYEIEEGRPIWKLYPAMLGVTLSLVILVMVMMLILILSGPVAEQLGGLIGLGGTTVAVWNIAKWPVLLLLLILMIAVLYYFTPNVRQPKFRWISLGAVIAIVVMGLATAGFGFYVSNFGNYNATYGTIGGIIVLLLWLWIMNVILLYGAEFDAETERGRQLQAGIEAEETVQLPPRDTKQIEKTEEKEAKLVHDGRMLRKDAEAANGDNGSDTGNRGSR